MPLKVNTEHISFEDDGSYLDVKVHESNGTISINTAEMIVSEDSIEDCNFYVTFEDWLKINREVRKLFKNMKK